MTGLEVAGTLVGTGVGTVVLTIMGARRYYQGKQDGQEYPQNGGRMDERVKVLEAMMHQAAKERDMMIAKASKHSNRLGILENTCNANDSRLAVLYDKIAEMTKDVKASVKDCKDSIEAKLDTMDNRYHDLDKRQTVTEGKVEELRQKKS